jgi:hypothetical protein
MPELPLDHVDRHPLSCELDRMRVPQLMRSEPPPHPSRSSQLPQLATGSRRGPAGPAGLTFNRASSGSRMEMGERVEPSTPAAGEGSQV